jgi:hypothetical protein
VRADRCARAPPPLQQPPAGGMRGADDGDSRRCPWQDGGREKRGRGRQPLAVAANVRVLPKTESSPLARPPQTPTVAHGEAVLPPTSLSFQRSSGSPALPADWPVPQARHSPAYLSAEARSAAMAAVAVDSVAIFPLRWWTSGRNRACEETGNLGYQTLIQGQKMADWRPRAPVALLYTRTPCPAHPLPDPPLQV